MPQPSGNRCGHDPRQPVLAVAVPIPKGRGGFPRILSLAAERAKAWYFHPKKCPPLQGHPGRQTRSERREACQIVLETILRHLDLASMCLGTPTLANGFIDIDMRTIVHDSGISQRRCERAISLLKQAGFMRVQQPRTRNEEGAYFGCRAIRVVTETLFEWLGLAPMLQRERARASERLRRKAQKANRKLADFMRRVVRGMKKAGFTPRPSPGTANTCLEPFLERPGAGGDRTARGPAANQRGHGVSAGIQPRPGIPPTMNGNAERTESPFGGFLRF